MVSLPALPSGKLKMLARPTVIQTRSNVRMVQYSTARLLDCSTACTAQHPNRLLLAQTNLRQARQITTDRGRLRLRETETDRDKQRDKETKRETDKETKRQRYTQSQERKEKESYCTEGEIQSTIIWSQILWIPKLY